MDHGGVVGQIAVEAGGDDQARTALDGRAKALEDEIRETFALAMSDFSRSLDSTGVGSTSSGLLERLKFQDAAAWQRLVQLV